VYERFHLVGTANRAINPLRDRFPDHSVFIESPVCPLREIHRFGAMGDFARAMDSAKN
jgi:hypothetical protein